MRAFSDGSSRGAPLPLSFSLCVISSGADRSLTALINIHYRHGAPDASRRLQAARTGLLGLAEILPVAVLRGGCGHGEARRHEEEDDDGRPPCHRVPSNVEHRLLFTRTASRGAERSLSERILRHPAEMIPR